MALVRDEYWLKLAGRDRSRETRKSREIWRVGKSEEVGFKARKKLVTRKRAWEGVELITVVEWCVSDCQEQRILDLLVERSISEERSCGMIDQQT